MQGEHLVAHRSQFHRWLFCIAQGGDCFFGRNAFGILFFAAGECLKRRDGFSISQSSKRVNGGELDSLLFAVHIIEEELAQGFFLFLVSGQVSEILQPATETACRKGRLPFLQSVVERANVTGIILRSHRIERGISQHVAVRGRVQIFEQLFSSL